MHAIGLLPWGGNGCFGFGILLIEGRIGGGGEGGTGGGHTRA